MKLIRPTVITDAILTSSTVAEPESGWPAWASGTTYALNAQSSKSHRRFVSAVASNVGHDPTSTATADIGKWVDNGPTNRWAMFDQGVGSLTTDTGSITVVLTPGSIDSLVILDTDAETATVTMTVSGTNVYSQTQSTNVGGAAITDWFLYFFEAIGKKTVLSFLDLPVYPSAIVTVQLNAANPTGPVSVGSLIVGRQLEIGSTEAGASVGIIDYSLKNTDAFGVTTVVERAWSKRAEARCILDTTQVDAMQRELAKVRAIPVVWILEDGFDSLTIYGFFKEFTLDLTYANLSYCSLTIEGLV